MSFYSDASLVMIPSGYKTSKVYSAVPTDGSGDLVFTRTADTATRVGPDGLIEKVRTNLQTYSQDFSNAIWGKSAGATLTHSQTDPIGGTTASRLQMPSGTSNYFGSTFSGATNGGKYTHSIYMKSNTGSTQTVRMIDGVRGVAGGQLLASVTTSWQRFEVVITTASTSAGLQIDNAGGAYNNDILIAFAQSEETDFGATSYIATTTAAVSVGPVANVPRLDYLNSSCPRLLLEPQRTNLVTYSEQFNNAAWTKGDLTVSANNATSPDGYTNADRIVETSANGQHLAFQSLTVTNGTTYAFTVFLKAQQRNAVSLQLADASNRYTTLFDINAGTILTTRTTGSPVGTSNSIVSYGNGWYRCSITMTQSAGTTMIPHYALSNSNTPTWDGFDFPTYTGNTANGILAWGAQLEAGAYATSYIPTLGAAVTRGADAASKTSATALIGQTEGTLFAEVEVINTMDNIGIWLRQSGSVYDNIILMFFNGTRNSRFQILNGAVTQVDITGPVVSAGFHKIAAAYKANDFVLYVDGVQVGVVAVGSVPTCNEIYIDTYIDGGARNATKKSAILFPTRLQNSDLAALTA